jgi:pimeloyl-ACP methyl ester carboxylesterase
MTGSGRTVEVGGIETHYLDAGAGRALVLLHGAGPGVDANANWRFAIPALAACGRVLAPDIVGFGATERPPGVNYSMRVWLEHVVGFLNALEIDQASLVGNSFGAALALSLAVEYPDRVERLVLAGCPALSFPITAGLEMVWGYEPGRSNMRRLLQTLVYDRDAVTEEVVEARYRASADHGAREAYRRMFPPPRQRWVDAMALAEERVAGVRQPAMVIHGRDDRVVPLAVACRLHELLDESQLHVFGRCGHTAQIERANDFNALTARFLGP